MEKKIQLPKEAQPWTEVEVLFIDGCKVKCSPKVGQKLCGKAILNSVLDRT